MAFNICICIHCSRFQCPPRWTLGLIGGVTLPADGDWSSPEGTPHLHPHPHLQLMIGNKASSSSNSVRMIGAQRDAAAFLFLSSVFYMVSTLFVLFILHSLDSYVCISPYILYNCNISCLICSPECLEIIACIILCHSITKQSKKLRWMTQAGHSYKYVFSVLLSETQKAIQIHSLCVEAVSHMSLFIYSQCHALIVLFGVRTFPEQELRYILKPSFNTMLQNKYPSIIFNRFFFFKSRESQQTNTSRWHVQSYAL